MHRILATAALFVLSSGPAAAQDAMPDSLPPESRAISLSGPRAGLTILFGGAADLADRELGIAPVITQFGWQFERRFFASESGLSGVSEWVLLLGGLEQGTAVPSLTWLAGIRNADGLEFGLGPNVTPAGVALVLAAGATIPSGSMNFPLHMAVASSDSGLRISALVGFTTRR